MADIDCGKTRRGGITMSSLQRTISRALATKGLNKKQALRKRIVINEDKRHKRREKHEHAQNHMH